MKKKTKKRINLIITYVIITFIGVLMLYPIPVSYTHLDVYKRQE